MKWSKAYSQSGSSMGRASYNRPSSKPRSVRLFRVRLNSGGYDNGGAYWGTGEPLFCAMGDEDSTGEEQYRDFVRARSRAEAMKKLGLSIRQMKCKQGLSFDDFEKARC